MRGSNFAGTGQAAIRAAGKKNNFSETSVRACPPSLIDGAWRFPSLKEGFIA